MFSPDGRYIPLSNQGRFKTGNQFRIVSLREGMKGITVSGKIVRIGERKAIKTRYGESLLVPCAIEDETGRIALNLWGAQTVFAREGSMLKLYGCYVLSYNRELQLSIAKKGAIQIL